VGYDDKTPMGGDEADGFSALVPYLEAVFLRYDTDSSGALDPGEVKEAFKRFNLTVKEVAPAIINASDYSREVLFHFLLAHGRKPGTFAWNDTGEPGTGGRPSQALEFATFQASWMVGMVDYRADRGRVLEIIAALCAKPGMLFPSGF
jgi:hypothetical protein